MYKQCLAESFRILNIEKQFLSLKFKNNVLKLISICNQHLKKYLRVSRYFGKVF